MTDWENQKQMIREKVEKVFADVEKRGVYKARFECEVSADAIPDFTYTIRQVLCDVGESKDGEVVTGKGSYSHDAAQFENGELAVIREMLNNFRVDGERKDG